MYKKFFNIYLNIITTHHLHFFLYFFLLTLLECITYTTSHAASIEPGIRLESLCIENNQTKLDLAIWYPTLQKPIQINYGDWNIIASHGAKPYPGKYPAIILSHDSAGSRFSLHELATTLTQKGYIVVSVTHQGDNADDMSLMFTIKQITGRVHQLNIIIDFLMNDQELFDILDTQKIGIIGIGTGGTAALLLGGAKLDPSAWWDYCNNIILPSSSIIVNDAYCSSWVKPKMNILAQQIDPQETYNNPRITAIVVVAPGFGMFFSKESLASLSRPILLVEATKDYINPPKYHSQYIEKQLSTYYEMIVLSEASTATLISPCSESLEQVLPEMCSKELDVTKQLIQKEIANTSAAFFTRCFSLFKK
ncbi:dienelactone hydrolase [Lawsonia intracellularis]|uniref:Predicted dienelactone hydrolase n=1 Tax=Lawsonia intracellularis (strain PHE/MN1-00) TaxID=363253 RepID=Q1MPS8_LAWIP|nr:dienelactone hydrolase [Lawsonia intracellularis]AGC50372.1 dienelactone hydrolase-like protein [Lawsonia intracellularis N343]KAA0204393.1 dienelactone hydrolase [Lawsonia intracellularis]MBZ3892817.1 dienelactone hydrolase [Lawsonia intracellularis]OMQ02841.1 dienelactone hydrolase [Lawsonia intracellularis]RBN33022.1 dienelactone hydrolase [Lawsonia intracellularis]